MPLAPSPMPTFLPSSFWPPLFQLNPFVSDLQLPSASFCSASAAILTQIQRAQGGGEEIYVKFCKMSSFSSVTRGGLFFSFFFFPLAVEMSYICSKKMLSSLCWYKQGSCLNLFNWQLHGESTVCALDRSRHAGHLASTQQSKTSKETDERGPPYCRRWLPFHYIRSCSPLSYISHYLKIDVQLQRISCAASLLFLSAPWVSKLNTCSICI